MNKKILNIPKEDFGRIIGAGGRNLRLINKCIAPGRLKIDNEEVILFGDFEDKIWSQRAIRVLRSARRGGIVKWFGVWEREEFQQDGNEEWLRKIRAIQDKTKCEVQQMEVHEKGKWYEVWVVLEESPSTEFETAINRIGAIVHKRYRLRKKKKKHL